jgi:hypothetical protein
MPVATLEFRRYICAHWIPDHSQKAAAMKPTILFLLALTFLSCAGPPKREGKGFRNDNNGWVFIHCEGSPRERGYQHGVLLADEIEDVLTVMAGFVNATTHKEWSFYRDAAERMFWPKLEPEYQEEIEGIVAGLRARGKEYDRLDITALNGWIELGWYYIPSLAQRVKADSLENRAPGNCSAFIATGTYTADGKIVMAHNAWVDYVVGQRWNVIMDLVPARGNRMLMDCIPGTIHSGDDFVISNAGLLITETTITQFKGFLEDGVPEFARARTAAQYARSIDEFVTIMAAENNGGYANTWLVGDLKTNEIAMLDLGLKHQTLWRTNDGVFVGSNFATDERIIAEETTFNAADSMNSANTRRKRWGQIMDQQKGRITAELAMQFLADHGEAHGGPPVLNGRVLCGHNDRDSLGIPEWSNPPYYPTGAVQGKVTTATLASNLQLWARMGHPCGTEFIAANFLTAHPEYKWQELYLKDMKPNPWTLFSAKR